MRKKAGLQSKFVLIFLLVGLIPVMAVTMLAYYNAKAGLEAESFKALQLYAGQVASRITTFLSGRESSARSFAASGDVLDALHVLRQVEGDVQNQAWLAEKIHLDRYVHTLREGYGYMDVSITDQNGKIVYSSTPGLEGVDLSGQEHIKDALTGQLSWSPLHYSEVMHQNIISVAAPIRTDGLTGAVFGTATLVVGNHQLTAYVTEGLDELGKTADAYLLDAQGLLLTDTKRGDYALNAALQKTVTSEAVYRLAGPLTNGEAGFFWRGLYRNYLGDNVLGAVEVIGFGEGFAGLVVEIASAEAFAGVYSMRNYMLIVLFVAVFLVAGAGYAIAGATARPIAKIAETARQVAAGDFTVSADIKRNDEIGELGNAFNTMNENLRQLFRQAVQTAAGVNEGSEAPSQAVESVSASLQQVAASTNQFASNTQEMSTNSQQMAELSRQVADSAASGSAGVENAVRQMQEISTMVEELRKVIDALDKRSQDIGGIVRLITDVAEQTNLLALNAAIEAARAGEQGRGFAVVAEEVRKLAEQSRSAAEKIAKLVSETQEETKHAVSGMQKGVATVRSGSEVVLASGETFKEIVSKVTGIVKKIELVASSAEEVSAASEEIAASTEEQSSVMQEINASAEELRANADALIQELNRFKY